MLFKNQLGNLDVVVVCVFFCRNKYGSMFPLLKCGTPHYETPYVFLTQMTLISLVAVLM